MKDLNFKETSEKYRNEMMKLYGAKFKMDNIKKEEPDSEIKIEYNEKIEDNKEIPEVLNEQEDEDIVDEVTGEVMKGLRQYGRCKEHDPRLKQL